tara:strand:+ start:190 stop:447 length:258 start_codon:yes stop_codon:yes gene_type:complete
MSRPTKPIQTYRQYNLSKPKTPDYENLDEGDYLLIPAEKFVSPQYISVSGNTEFDDFEKLEIYKKPQKIPSGKYVVVKFIEIQEY